MAIIDRLTEKANFLTPIKFTRDGDVVWGPLRYHWGVPGVGKSAMIEDLAYYLGAERFFPLVASQCRPDDVGLPFLDESGEFYTQVVPDWVYYLDNCESALLFLDEMGDGSRAVQAMFQQITNERRIGSFKLGGHIRIIAAGNPKNVSTLGIELAPAPANRGGHVNIPFGEDEANDFTNWLLSDQCLKPDTEQIDLKAEEARTLAAWPTVSTKWRRILAGFIKRQGDAKTVLDLPEKGDPRRSRAWASPRSVYTAICAAASSEIHGLDDARREAYVGSFVGESWAAEFFNYAENLDLIDPDDLLEGKATFTYDPRRADIAMVTLHSAAQRLVTRSKEAGDTRTKLSKQTMVMAKRLWSVMGPVADKSVDTAAMPAVMLIQNGLHANCKQATKVCQQMLPVLEASGYRDLMKGAR